MNDTETNINTDTFATGTGFTLERLAAVREILNRGTIPQPYQQEVLQRMLGERDLARRGRDEGTGAVWRANPEGLVRISCSTSDPGLNRKQRRALARARLTLSRLPANHGSEMVPGRPDQLGEKRPVVLQSEKADPFCFAP